jgi:5-methylcytosine-specific restriction endonuclease McrA
VLTKRCSKCRMEKGIDEFPRNKSERDGLFHYCKTCSAELSRKQRAKNAAQESRLVVTEKRCPKCKTVKPISEFYQSKYTRDGFAGHCKSCHLANTQAHDKQHPEKRREAARRRRRNNPEKERSVFRRYRLTHGDKLRAREQKWRDLNPERRREHNRRYMRKHPEKNRAYVLSRIARKRAAAGIFKDTDIKRQYDAQDGLCFWCSEVLGKKWAIDHVIALNRGGSNWPANLVCACQRCNSSKSDKLPWIEWQPRNPLQPSHPALDEYLNRKQNE